MKKILITVAILASTTFVFSQSKKSVSPSNLKIGVISLQELIAKMPEAQSADSTLQAFQGELEVAYAEVLKELREKDSLFRTDSSKWTSTVKNLKRSDLQRLYQQLQSWQQTAEQSIQRKQQELLVPLRNKAMAAIEKVARKNNFTHVLEKSVVYFSNDTQSDLLSLVEQELKTKK